MKKEKTKLVFTKETVTDLTDQEINKVNGGCQWGDSSGFTVTTNTSIIIPTGNVSIGNPNTITEDLLNPFTTH